MRDDHTPAVLRAIEAASNWANRLRRPATDPLVLALALLDDDEGQAAELLVRAGVDLPAGRVRLQSSVEDAGSLADVWTVAADLARSLSGERTIRSDHLILALVQTSEPVRSELAAAGLDVEGLLQCAQADGPAPLALDEPLDLAEQPEDMATARILDAAANRAREALRVIEDYARFALNDELLSRELKEMRHGLREALESVGPLPLLAARDTLGDVGTEIQTVSESARGDAIEVIRANFKRLQEAMRSLEEYGKIVAADLGPAIERLRYRSYTLERALLLGRAARDRLASARLYLLLTGSTCATSLEYVVAEAAAGGVDVVQLREKSLGDRELLERARNVRRWTQRDGLLFIVNDRPDIARLVDADGVHLGQDDLTVAQARRIVGGDMLVGVSTHSLEQLRQAVLDGANYVGIGPVFPSATKQFEEFPGLPFVRDATKESTVPMFALGGISVENIEQVLAAGATRIAVSSAICQSDDPGAAARALRARIDIGLGGGPL